MNRIGIVAIVALTSSAFFAPGPPQGGDLARRISSAPDGLVKMTYAAREGICGDGRSFVAEGPNGARGFDVWFTDGMSMSTMTGDIGARCVRGPVRLLLVVRDHRIVDVQPFVGPSTAATTRAGLELGTVAGAEVARYMLDLASRGREDVARNAILAASIADSVRIAQPLAAMARNKALESSVRESALKWVGRVAVREGDRDATRVARSILDDRDDQLDVRERAVRVIGEEPDGPAYLRSAYARTPENTLRERIVRMVGESGTRADLDWVRNIALDRNERVGIRERAVRMLGEASDAKSLRELYDRLEDATLRERIIRLMAESGDAESRRWLRELVERKSESSAVRERAIRSLAEMGDLAYLQSSYRSIDDDGLRERILRSVAEGGGADTKKWLADVARDTKEQSSLRERAVRSLAESGVATSELVSLYDGIADRTVRDRLVSLLAERGDRAARDKLRAIAENDPDEDLRRRAVRKLAESR
jgi:HEAT repeat protein